MGDRPRIGNDVVDLGDPITAVAHLRPRWLRRVFCADEVERITAAAAPAAVAWSLFAAKEAAFKALSKRRERLVFAHRQFRVAADLGSVRHGELTLTLRVDQDGDCIHAVAVLGSSAAPAQQVAQVPPGADLGRAARALLCGAQASRLGCRPEDLTVVRAPVPGSWDGYGPPRLHRRGVPVAGDVSLSHDGRYVAFAALAA